MSHAGETAQAGPEFSGRWSRYPLRFSALAALGVVLTALLLPIWTDPDEIERPRVTLWTALARSSFWGPPLETQNPIGAVLIFAVAFVLARAVHWFVCREASRLERALMRFLVILFAGLAGAALAAIGSLAATLALGSSPFEGEHEKAWGGLLAVIYLFPAVVALTLAGGALGAFLAVRLLRRASRDSHHLEHSGTTGPT